MRPEGKCLMLRQYTRVQFFLEEGIRCVGLVSVSWVLWGCALLRAPASCLEQKNQTGNKVERFTFIKDVKVREDKRPALKRNALQSAWAK